MERPFSIALVAGWLVLGGVAAAYAVRNYLYAYRFIDSRLGKTVIGLGIVVAVLLVITLCATAAGLWQGEPVARRRAFVLLVVLTAFLLLGAHYALAAANAVAFAVLMREKQYFAQRARSM